MHAMLKHRADGSDENIYIYFHYYVIDKHYTCLTTVVYTHLHIIIG